MAAGGGAFAHALACLWIAKLKLEEGVETKRRSTTHPRKFQVAVPGDFSICRQLKGQLRQVWV